MTLPDLDTSVGYSFGHEIDGVVTTQTQEVYGRKSEQDVIELKQNTSDGKHVIKKMPGGPNAVEATLARGLTAESSFEKWVRTCCLG